MDRHMDQRVSEPAGDLAEMSDASLQRGFQVELQSLAYS